MTSSDNRPSSPARTTAADRSAAGEPAADPTVTDHPAGDGQAAANTEDEPAG